MTDHVARGRMPGLTTARLMFLVLMCALSFWFVEMLPPESFHKDTEHFRIYKTIALALLLYLIGLCLWRSRPDQTGH